MSDSNRSSGGIQELPFNYLLSIKLAILITLISVGNEIPLWCRHWKRLEWKWHLIKINLRSSGPAAFKMSGLQRPSERSKLASSFLPETHWLIPLVIKNLILLRIWWDKGAELIFSSSVLHAAVMWFNQQATQKGVVRCVNMTQRHQTLFFTQSTWVLDAGFELESEQIMENTEKSKSKLALLPGPV